MVLLPTTPPKKKKNGPKPVVLAKKMFQIMIPKIVFVFFGWKSDPALGVFASSWDLPMVYTEKKMFFLKPQKIIAQLKFWGTTSDSSIFLLFLTSSKQQQRKKNMFPIHPKNKICLISPYSPNSGGLR